MAFQPELALSIEGPGGRAPLSFVVRHIVCAGYTSRDRSDAERHIQELGSLGIARPKEVPIFFAVASYLATTEQVIEVQGPFTSGEAEVALLLGPDGPWVTVASDQTDRFVERHSVPAAKQLCPKVLAPTAWRLADVEGHWDELVLRAWVRSGRKRQLYQEAKLGSLLALDVLLAGLREHTLELGMRGDACPHIPRSAAIDDVGGRRGAEDHVVVPVEELEARAGLPFPRGHPILEVVPVPVVAAIELGEHVVGVILDIEVLLNRGPARGAGR